MDPPLIYLQSYANGEWALQDTAGENLQVMYWSGHLVMEQNDLVAQQPPLFTRYVRIQNVIPNLMQVYDD